MGQSRKDQVRPPFVVRDVDGRKVKLYQITCLCGEGFESTKYFLKFAPEHEECKRTAKCQAMAVRRRNQGFRPRTRRLCSVCGEPVPDVRPGATTCSEACKQAYRQQKDLKNDPLYARALLAYERRCAWASVKGYPLPENKERWLLEKIEEMHFEADAPPVRVVESAPHPEWSGYQCNGVYVSPRD